MKANLAELGQGRSQSLPEIAEIRDAALRDNAVEASAFARFRAKFQRFDEICPPGS